MREDVTRASGLVLAAGYSAIIVWLFASQPETLTEALGGLSSGLGAYAVDERAFQDGVTFFRNEQFVEARAAFDRADAAKRDARTQFYIAYSYYRQGWHRTHSDDTLYREGLAAVERAIALAPAGRLVADDDDLQMRSADELRAELRRGLVIDASDLNPTRLFERRK